MCDRRMAQQRRERGAATGMPLFALHRTWVAWRPAVGAGEERSHTLRCAAASSVCDWPPAASARCGVLWAAPPAPHTGNNTRHRTMSAHKPPRTRPAPRTAATIAPRAAATVTAGPAATAHCLVARRARALPAPCPAARPLYNPPLAQVEDKAALGRGRQRVHGAGRRKRRRGEGLPSLFCFQTPSAHQSKHLPPWPPPPLPPSPVSRTRSMERCVVGGTLRASALLPASRRRRKQGASSLAHMIRSLPPPHTRRLSWRR